MFSYERSDLSYRNDNLNLSSTYILLFIIAGSEYLTVSVDLLIYAPTYFKISSANTCKSGCVAVSNTSYPKLFIA